MAVEDAFTGFQASHLPWIDPRSIPKPCLKHPLIGPTLANFKAFDKSLGKISFPGPMTPLTQNPDFPADIPAVSRLRPLDLPTLRAQAFFNRGILLSHSDVSAKFRDFDIPLFKFFQIRHFLNSTPSTSKWHRALTPFEHLCSHTTPQRHLIAFLYSLLISTAKPNTDIHRLWEADLSIVLSDEEWEKVWTHILKGSVNVSTQEDRFKLYSRWYRTPDKIHKIFPAVPSTCWRCNSDTGSLLHIWWTCPLIQPYWREVHRLISQITTFSSDFTPAQYLLHHTSLPKSTYHKSLLLHLINAITQCLPIR